MGLILNTLLSLPHFIYVCKSQKNKVFITAFNLSCLSHYGDYMTHHILIYGDGTIRRQMAQKNPECAGDILHLYFKLQGFLVYICRCRRGLIHKSRGFHYRLFGDVTDEG